MTEQQPYDGGSHEGYDPYRQQRQPGGGPGQAWPDGSWDGRTGHDRGGRPGDGHGHARGGYEEQHTQQWQGQTWETQMQPPVAPAAGPAHGQQQTPAPQAYGEPQQAGPETHARQPYQQNPQQQPYQQNPQPYQQQAQHQHPYAQPQPQGQPYAQPQAQPDAQPYAQQQPYAQPQHDAQPYAQPQVPAHAHPQQAYEPVAAGAAPAETGHAGQAAASAAPAGDEPSYGPATVGGNTRVTDAQRARLEGRSPIIDPGMQPAALTALLGLLLAGAAAVGSYGLAVPLVALQAVTAAGWFRLNGMWPARQGIALAFLGALTADVAVLVAGRDHAPSAILGPLGVWVLLALVLQLRSHADPDERMYGLMATVASTALAVLATGYLGADPDAVSVGAVAVAVAVLARALPMPTAASVAVSLLAAAGAGIAVGGLTGFGSAGAVLGAAAAACALIGHRVAAYDYPSRFVHFTAGVALPLSAAAPVVWLLGRALG